jgi:hypothetical protein
MPLNLIFLTIPPLSPLRIRNPIKVASANILPKPACRELSLEHLVNLLQGAVLDLREVEVHPYDGDEAGWAPDPACVLLA